MGHINAMHSDEQTIAMFLRLSGSTKFDTSPGGGGINGTSAREIGMMPVAFDLLSRWNGLRRPSRGRISTALCT